MAAPAPGMEFTWREAQLHPLSWFIVKLKMHKLALKSAMQLPYRKMLRAFLFQLSHETYIRRHTESSEQ